MGPLSHHPLSTSIPQPLPPSPSVGAWTVRVGHVSRSVLGQSKVKAILPWPHGYHSTFILSAPLDPDREAPWRGGCNTSRVAHCCDWGNGPVWGRLTSPSCAHFALSRANSVACPALSIGVSRLLPITFPPDYFSSLVKLLRLFGIIIMTSWMLFTSLSDISRNYWYKG